MKKGHLKNGMPYHVYCVLLQSDDVTSSSTGFFCRSVGGKYHSTRNIYDDSMYTLGDRDSEPLPSWY